MFLKEVFSQRLKETRIKNGEKQYQLADYLGINKSRVSEMEKGLATTSFDKLVMICEHYNISADYLLGLKDEP